MHHDGVLLDCGMDWCKAVESPRSIAKRKKIGEVVAGFEEDEQCVQCAVRTMTVSVGLLWMGSIFPVSTRRWLHWKYYVMSTDDKEIALQSLLNSQALQII